MKENYKRIIKGILLICLTFFMGFNVIDVSAEEKKCQTDNFKGNIKNNPNSKIITISANGDKNQWNAYLIEPEDLRNVQNDFTYTGISYTLSNDTIQISYNGYTSDNIGILLVKTNNECADANTIIQKIESARTTTVTIDDDDDENKNKSYYLEGFGYQIIKPVHKEPISNNNKDSLCAQLQAGDSNCVKGTGISQSVFDASWQGVTTQQKYKSYIPACYKSSLSSKPTNQEIKNQIANAITAYYFDNIGSIGTLPTIHTGAINVKDPTKKIGLTCDYLNIDTSRDYYVNKNYYYHEEESNNSITINDNKYTCKKICREVMKVEYGPPVASIAGLCFEYKVRVTSEIACQTTPEGDLTPPNSDNYKTCEPVAYCESSTKKGSDKSAGPNEEFDSCVNSCDNGKYTQKCINKCYNKVYANSNNQLLSYADKVEATKLASCSGNVTNKNLYGTNNAGANLSQEILSNSDNHDCYGYYKWSNGEIIWVPGSSEAYWAQYARFYFLNSNVAAETIAHDEASINEPGSGRWKKNNEIWYYKASKKSSLQHKDGFKIASKYKGGTTSGGVTCDWNCSFIGCNVGDKLNSGDVKDTYNDDSETYRNFLNKCAAEASCSTKTAEFTIKVNNKTKDKPNEDNWINYNAATLTNTTSAVDINDESNIILNRSGCYGETINKNNYMTEWSFPGTWVNNKTGEISYKEKEGTTWHKKTDKFCTSLNSADVNVGWWYYGAMKALGKSDDESKKNAVTGETMTDEQLKAAVTEKNIVATVAEKKTDNKDFDDLEGAFGHFHWKIEVKCFYALYDTATIPCADNDPSCPPCTGPLCDPDPCTGSDCNPVSYRIRTVDNADLFPSTEGKTTTDPTKTGRTPGFNWTSNARNNKNSNYKINPDKLLTKIQTEGDGIYSNDDNVDYKFVLDRTALSEIRKYNKEQGNYRNYGKNFSIINGVSVYSSDLIRKGLLSDIKYSPIKGTLGCNNEKFGVCDNDLKIGG
ncbi:MAG: hypothetical protein PUA97_02950 [bacterium]|nr:hypothetical protein [bacterium]